MNILVYLCGIYSLGFAIFHLFFWRLFDWKNELKKLSLANRAILQIANIRLIYICMLVAFLCFCFPTDLTTTTLGKTFLGGMSLFWFGRTVEQFIFLRINKTFVHVLTALFIIGAIIFALPVFLS
ncbi:hypothetical protein [Spirosoma luteum]|uniref:hypothetical protein n=1 Tax=Spirosoma luteum TaxID=431553 RepID=UPI000365F525|nr:hypothetical protein [Spirosoma luteum]